MVDPDRAIVAAVKAGDTEAFRGLVDRHKGRVYGVLMSLVGDEALAEELAQDTFVKAYTGLAGFQENATFGTWLVQIAIHNARDHRRRTQRMRRHRVVSLEALREAREDTFEPPDTTRRADPSSAIESEQDRNRVWMALSRIPAEYREVIVLKHLLGWSYEEIAASTGDSTGTLKVRAHRARRMMHDYLVEIETHTGVRMKGNRNAPTDKKERENG